MKIKIPRRIYTLMKRFCPRTLYICMQKSVLYSRIKTQLTPENYEEGFDKDLGNDVSFSFLYSKSDLNLEYF